MSVDNGSDLRTTLPDMDGSIVKNPEPLCGVESVGFGVISTDGESADDKCFEFVDVSSMSEVEEQGLDPSVSDFDFGRGREDFSWRLSCLELDINSVEFPAMGGVGEGRFSETAIDGTVFFFD